GPYARGFLHDGFRRDEPYIQPDWRFGFVPSRLASCQRSRANRKARQDSDLAYGSVWRVPRQACGSFGRRRDTAGQLAHVVRIEHVQQRSAQWTPAADRRRRWSWRKADWWTTH